MREFTATDGTTWQAWEVIPGQGTRRADGALLPDEYRSGWLCFSNGAERRRLAPLPARWKERADAELDVLRRAATPVRSAQPSGA
ncbi:MAG TPA: hypothetical protein VFJ16_25070 [Longimicrobium sp.]|nr:hypothetical protein [Longimicrobium sp.]